jgi:adenylate cyclase
LIDPDNRSMRYNLACSLSGNFADVEGTITLLAPYLEGASASELEHLTIDPDMDPVRDDPRFKALIAKTQARLAAYGAEAR